MNKEPKQYPSYVICIDGEPLVEDDDSITLYQDDDDRGLKDRFFAIVALSTDSTTVTIKKFKLTPYDFEVSLPKTEFLKRARETKEVG